MITITLLIISVCAIVTAQQYAEAHMLHSGIPAVYARRFYVGRYSAGANVGAGIFYGILATLAALASAVLGWLVADSAWAFALYAMLLINGYWVYQLASDLKLLHRYGKLF